MFDVICTKACLWNYAVKRELARLFYEENGEVNVVATVLLIAVAVGLVLLFKDEVADLIGDVFDNLDVSGLSSKPQ